MGKIVLGVFLLFLAVLLLIPVGVRVVYDEELYVWLRVAGIPIRMIPGKDKKKKAKKEKTQESTEEPLPEPSDSEQKKDGFLEKIKTVRQNAELIRQLLGSFVRLSRKRIRIKKLGVSITYGSTDAASTAISVGAIWASLYGFLPALDRLFAVRTHRFSVKPSYQEPTFFAKAEGILESRPVHIMFIGLILGIRYFKYKRNIKKVVKKHG